MPGGVVAWRHASKASIRNPLERQYDEFPLICSGNAFRAEHMSVDFEILHRNVNGDPELADWPRLLREKYLIIAMATWEECLQYYLKPNEANRQPIGRPEKEGLYNGTTITWIN